MWNFVSSVLTLSESLRTALQSGDVVSRLFGFNVDLRVNDN